MKNQPAIQLRWLPHIKPAVIAAIGGFLVPVSISCVIGVFGAFLLLMLMVCVVVPVGIVLALINEISAACRREPLRPVGASICRVALVVAIFTTAQIPGLIAGFGIQQLQVTTAEHWCESLIPHLEAFRTRTGEYPSDLSQLGIELDPPFLCRGGGLLYLARQNDYTFDFFDGGWLSGYWYSSDKGSWGHYD